MLSSRLISKISNHRHRISSSLRLLHSKNAAQCVQTLRRNSTTAQAVPKQANKKPILPERLLIFHAGTGRSVFLGCLKITTIFIFGFFALFLAPAQFQSEDQPKWVAAGVFLSGVVPVVFVSYITSPFVANIHLRLPTFARYSREMAVRYSQALPKDANLEITKVNFIGMPRAKLVKVADLYRTNQRLGVVNYVWNVQSRKMRVLGIRGRGISRFGIHGGVRIPQGKDVWDNIAKTIAKRSI